MHSQITQELQSREEQISLIESRLKDLSISTTMPERPYTSSQYQRHEAIMRDFVQMEEQVSDFDREISDLLSLQ